MKLRLSTLPLSTNHFYGQSGGRRFLRPEVRVNKEAMGWEARSQFHREPMTGPLKVSVALYWPTRANHDVDNVKGLLDAMTGILWQDDGQIVDLRISKKYNKSIRASTWKLWRRNKALLNAATAEPVARVVRTTRVRHVLCGLAVEKIMRWSITYNEPRDLLRIRGRGEDVSLRSGEDLLQLVRHARRLDHKPTFQLGANAVQFRDRLFADGHAEQICLPRRNRRSHFRDKVVAIINSSDPAETAGHMVQDFLDDRK